ncbi:putative holin-like toxin [uncultured Dialister sp.]|uniref:putative holin-like toxin n=1 Tax=uncultured Dialister sp. TaxID=278064 RepID=UPI00345BADDA
MNVYEALSLMIGFGILIATIMSKEALIKSLSDFILVFLFNARNQSTRIASYLRSPMTKQCIKILIKADSMN